MTTHGIQINGIYKTLVILTLIFILLEYFYGSVIEKKNWGIFNVVYNSPETNISYNGQTKHKIYNLAVFKLSENLTQYKNISKSNIVSNKLTNQNDFGKNSSLYIKKNTSSITSETKSLCPIVPPGLVGPIKVHTYPIPAVYELESEFNWLEDGGSYSPKECISHSIVAVIVPYRKRARQLLLFLKHIHPFLKRQQLNYTIFIVEQYGNGPFNRAKLMNVGFSEALKQRNFLCFIFHDVDLLPEDDRNLYTCPEQPRHMSVAVDAMNYRLPYATIFGGVSALTKEQFINVNGFSNQFWGWGGEDDDMSNRVRYHNYVITRYPTNIARYKMLSHSKEKANPKRYEFLNSGKKRFHTDGINSLNYTLKMISLTKLYTWVYVDIHGDEANNLNS